MLIAEGKCGVDIAAVGDREQVTDESGCSTEGRDGQNGALGEGNSQLERAQ